MTTTIEVPEGTICTTAWCKHYGTAGCTDVNDDHVAAEQCLTFATPGNHLNGSAYVAVSKPAVRDGAAGVYLSVESSDVERLLTADEAEAVAAAIHCAAVRLRGIEATS